MEDRLASASPNWNVRASITIVRAATAIGRNHMLAVEDPDAAGGDNTLGIAQTGGLDQLSQAMKEEVGGHAADARERAAFQKSQELGLQGAAHIRDF